MENAHTLTVCKHAHFLSLFFPLALLIIRHTQVCVCLAVLHRLAAAYKFLVHIPLYLTITIAIITNNTYCPRQIYTTAIGPLCSANSRSAHTHAHVVIISTCCSKGHKIVYVTGVCTLYSKHTPCLVYAPTRSESRSGPITLPRVSPSGPRPAVRPYDGD